jgi:predicted glycoside hydrolase/deacetylase ChbG (UPF0249 family)
MAPAPQRFLIVNADDFGLSAGVNRGVVRAHEEGIVTSASLMVHPPAAAAAAEYARRRPGLSVGLHLDVGEWVYRDGGWSALYEVVPAEDVGAVEAEVSRQVDDFLRLVGKPPTHVDSHQHAHREEPLLSAARRVAERYRVPLRHYTPGVQYRGDFYGQTGKGEPMREAITPDALLRVIHSLPAGVTELACHPGDAGDLWSTYRDERLCEMDTLSDPRIRAAVLEQRIQLITFASLPMGCQGQMH